MGFPDRHPAGPRAHIPRELRIMRGDNFSKPLGWCQHFFKLGRQTFQRDAVRGDVPAPVDNHGECALATAAEAIATELASVPNLTVEIVGAILAELRASGDFDRIVADAKASMATNAASR